MDHFCNLVAGIFPYFCIEQMIKEYGSYLSALCAYTSVSYTHLLLQNNTSKQVAADLLGHADTSFLERTYCHPQLESKQQAALILESMLEPAEQEAWEREQREAQRMSAAN